MTVTAHAPHARQRPQDLVTSLASTRPHNAAGCCSEASAPVRQQDPPRAVVKLPEAPTHQVGAPRSDRPLNGTQVAPTSRLPVAPQACCRCRPPMAGCWTRAAAAEPGAQHCTSASRSHGLRAASAGCHRSSDEPGECDYAPCDAGEGRRVSSSTPPRTVPFSAQRSSNTFVLATTARTRRLALCCTVNSAVWYLTRCHFVAHPLPHHLL